jgi:hypothetical protein
MNIPEINESHIMTIIIIAKCERKKCQTGGIYPWMDGNNLRVFRVLMARNSSR